jgi:hypothetical protein
MMVRFYIFVVKYGESRVLVRLRDTLVRDVVAYRCYGIETISKTMWVIHKVKKYMKHLVEMCFLTAMVIDTKKLEKNEAIMKT